MLGIPAQGHYTRLVRYVSSFEMVTAVIRPAPLSVETVTTERKTRRQFYRNVCDNTN